ncbi:BZ3500_MvSof-1268-A1-R1_Chr1-3g02488 [Microbotryum saponariae]|uniref:Man(5)GlcNAc(2)-PP-dolichol translocation protein RFT1 n=1 Tax=Microbotryum saponariae TaxID=289078 RepID=A0A2X0KVF7_9BASI|nr:BZ3500_MvSof-1268-A1-R1_Chr1-3g02488 [Microbotryum saponariae]SCZ96378.1 BZ3501_MvSof-1269-A2-R1_Chr1-3g02091 [Microbotryum saponariae]
MSKAPTKTREGKTTLQPPTSGTSSPLLRTTLSLVLLQLFSRLFSFSLNQLLLRSTTPEALGVATIGFDVARDTGLFFIREGLRGAVIRTRAASGSFSATNEQLVQQTLLLPALLSPLLLLLYPLSARVLTSPSSARPPHFYPTLSLYVLSALFELWSERDYLLTLRQWETLTSKRVRVEGFAVGVKALVTFAVVASGGERWALLAFGVGQAAYGLILLVGLRWSVQTIQGASKTPSIWSLQKLVAPATKFTNTQAPPTRRRFDPDLTSLGWALTKQSFIKQILTEADKIAISQLSTSRDQGGYALALNYGSLIARILFQPLEESSRLYFSRQLSTRPSHTLLASLLLLHTHLSLIFTLLVPPYIPALLHHLLGQRWAASSATSILQAYFFYLPFLALNGITEAYFQAIASQADLRKGSYWMGVCSIGFVAAVGVGARMGWAEKGLIMANCVNMAMRIGFSLRFIWRDAKGVACLQLRNWTPRISTVIVFAGAGSIVKWNASTWDWKSLTGLVRHVGVGALVGLGCLAFTFLMERRRVASLYQSIKAKSE